MSRIARERMKLLAETIKGYIHEERLEMIKLHFVHWEEEEQELTPGSTRFIGVF